MSGIHPPYRSCPPTKNDNRNNEEMDIYLRRMANIFVTEDGEQKRVHIVQKLTKVLKEWVIETAKSKNINENSYQNGGGLQIRIFGSTRLGVHNTDSDIDALCIAPSFITKNDFFIGFCEKLKKRDDVESFSSIPSAYTPVIKFTLDNQSIDMVFAAIKVEIIPENLDILDLRTLQGLDDQSVRSLNGARVAESLFRLVPNMNTYRYALRVIKYWAKQRGLYSNVLGFLGGVNFAILVAYVTQMILDACPYTLVQGFFMIFSHWSWPTPLLLRDFEDFQIKNSEGQLLPVWNPKLHYKDSLHIMPIITPAYPSMNSAYNVTQPQFRYIQEEIARGCLIFQEQTPESFFHWERLFKPCTNEFFRKYSTYIQIDIESFSAQDQRMWFGWIESRLRLLILAMEQPPMIACHPIANCFHRQLSVTPNEMNPLPIPLDQDNSIPLPLSNVDDANIPVASDWHPNDNRHEILNPEEQVSTDSVTNLNAKEENATIDTNASEFKSSERLSNSELAKNPFNQNLLEVNVGMSILYVSSFFIGLTTKEDNVDLTQCIQEFMYRVNSWTSKKESMKINIKKVEARSLPSFVFERSAEPSNVKNCTPKYKNQIGTGNSSTAVDDATNTINDHDRLTNPHEDSMMMETCLERVDNSMNETGDEYGHINVSENDNLVSKGDISNTSNTSRGELLHTSNLNRSGVYEIGKNIFHDNQNVGFNHPMESLKIKSNSTDNAPSARSADSYDLEVEKSSNFLDQNQYSKVQNNPMNYSNTTSFLPTPVTLSLPSTQINNNRINSAAWPPSQGNYRVNYVESSKQNHSMGTNQMVNGRFNHNYTRHSNRMNNNFNNQNYVNNLTQSLPYHRPHQNDSMLDAGSSIDDHNNPIIPQLDINHLKGVNRVQSHGHPSMGNGTTHPTEIQKMHHRNVQNHLIMKFANVRNNQVMNNPMDVNSSYMLNRGNFYNSGRNTNANIRNGPNNYNGNHIPKGQRSYSNNSNNVHFNRSRAGSFNQGQTNGIQHNAMNVPPIISPIMAYHQNPENFSSSYDSSNNFPPMMSNASVTDSTINSPVSIYGTTPRSSITSPSSQIYTLDVTYNDDGVQSAITYDAQQQIQSMIRSEITNGQVLYSNSSQSQSLFPPENELNVNHAFYPPNSARSFQTLSSSFTTDRIINNLPPYFVDPSTNGMHLPQTLDKNDSFGNADIVKADLSTHSNISLNTTARHSQQPTLQQILERHFKQAQANIKGHSVPLNEIESSATEVQDEIIVPIVSDLVRSQNVIIDIPHLESSVQNTESSVQNIKISPGSTQISFVRSPSANKLPLVEVQVDTHDENNDNNDENIGTFIVGTVVIDASQSNRFISTPPIDDDENKNRSSKSAGGFGRSNFVNIVSNPTTFSGAARNTVDHLQKSNTYPEINSESTALVEKVPRKKSNSMKQISKPNGVTIQNGTSSNQSVIDMNVTPLNGTRKVMELSYIEALSKQTTTTSQGTSNQIETDLIQNQKNGVIEVNSHFRGQNGIAMSGSNAYSSPVKRPRS